MYLPGIYTVNDSGLVLNPPDLRSYANTDPSPLNVSPAWLTANNQVNMCGLLPRLASLPVYGFTPPPSPLRPQLTALHTLLGPALFSPARGDSSRPSGVTVHTCVQAEALWEAISHQDVSVARPLTPSSAMWSASCCHHLRSRI